MSRNLAYESFQAKQNEQQLVHKRANVALSYVSYKLTLRINMNKVGFFQARDAHWVAARVR